MVSREGEILETFETSEARWQTGDTVIAHGNRLYRVVSVIPVERMAEFVDEPAGDARGRAALSAAALLDLTSEGAFREGAALR